MTFERFIDRPDKNEIIKSCPDFRIRAHGMPPTRVFYYFLSIPVITIFVLIYMVVNMTKAPEGELTLVKLFANTQFMLILIGVLISVITVFAAVLIKRIRDIVMHTEYQNMIFSSAMRAKSDFCIIVNENRKTLFFDDKFAKIFNPTDKEQDKLALILAHDGIKPEDKEKLRMAVESAKAVVVPATIGGKEETIEALPLARPLGCVVVRAQLK